MLQLIGTGQVFRVDLTLNNPTQEDGAKCSTKVQ